jgi:hypothetical protein
LGQSGLIEGDLTNVTAIDPNVTSLQPIWRDWRFVPMLHVSQDLEAGGSPDGDGDAVWDGFERWYYGDTSGGPDQDTDGDTATTLQEFLAGTDPTDSDTDDDNIFDGLDTVGQDRIRSGVFSLQGGFRKATTANRDHLRLAAKIGTSTTFDIPTNGLTVTVRDDDGDLYTVTVPGSAFTVSPNGRVFSYRDPDGTNNVLRSLTVRINARNTRRSSLRLRTIRTDFSAIALTARDVEVEVSVGSHTIFDRRLWEVRGSGLRPEN